VLAQYFHINFLLIRLLETAQSHSRLGRYVNLQLPIHFGAFMSFFKNLLFNLHFSSSLTKAGDTNQKKDAFNLFPNYVYSGKLRPYPQTPKRFVPATIERPDYADHPVSSLLFKQQQFHQ